jgi:KDO2-lipid IV(A) lauroyltransferase
LDIRPTGDRHADVAAITTEVNRVIEGWIRARPGQWLWLHRRWPR